MSFIVSEKSQDCGRKQGALRPQKPLRLIRDGEFGGSGISYLNTYWLHGHHQKDSALRWAAVLSEPFECFINCVDNVTRQCPQTPAFWRERRAEADRTEVLLPTILAPYRRAKPAHTASVHRPQLLFGEKGEAADVDSNWRTFAYQPATLPRKAKTAQMRRWFGSQWADWLRLLCSNIFDPAVESWVPLGPGQSPSSSPGAVLYIKSKVSSSRIAPNPHC